MTEAATAILVDLNRSLDKCNETLKSIQKKCDELVSFAETQDERYRKEQSRLLYGTNYG